MRGFDTLQQSITIEGTGNLVIRSLVDKCQFDDRRGDAARMGISSAMWPMFGLLWPSGLQLAALMSSRPMSPSGKLPERVLEIGCGLALASLVAHRRGADVTASDCHPLAAGFLKANLRLNHLAPMKYRHGNWASELPPLARNGTSKLRTVGGEFDLIIGSDVLYQRDEGALLPRFIALHASPSVEVWIVDPARTNRAAFNRQMSALGFGVTELRLDRAATATANAFKGRLLSYRRH
jgi:predicted nicotinamide N-methyase